MLDKMKEIKTMCENTDCSSCKLEMICDSYFEIIPNDWADDKLEERTRTVELIEGLRQAKGICSAQLNCNGCPIEGLCDEVFFGSPSRFEDEELDEYERE